MSEKWMWNGAPGASTRSPPARSAAKAGASGKPPSVTACRCAKSSTGRTQPQRSEIAKTSSAVPSSRTRPMISTPKATARSFCSSRLRRSPGSSAPAPAAQLPELLDGRVDRGGALTAEQEAGMEDDDLGSARLCDPGGVIEHPDRHVQLLPALRVAHEARDRGMHREDDVGFPRQLAKPLGPRVVHPELPLEVDLTGG